MERAIIAFVLMMTTICVASILTSPRARTEKKAGSKYRGLPSILLISLSVLAATGDGWASCSSYPGEHSGTNGWRFGNFEHSGAESNCNSFCKVGAYSGSYMTYSVEQACVKRGYEWYACYVYVMCDKEEEADSVSCLNSGKLWQNGSCLGQQEICEQSGGTWNGTSCDMCKETDFEPFYKCTDTFNQESTTNSDGTISMQNVPISSVYECRETCSGTIDCVPKQQIKGAGCSQVMQAFEQPNKPVECFAIIGSRCWLKTPSGDTYSCDCDGDCQVAIKGTTSDCQNPYSSSSKAESTGSSAESSTESAGSSAESSAESAGNSAGDGGGGNSSAEDWEYDYRLVLEAIQANTQYTGTEVHNQGQQANDYLRQIASKDFAPQVNVGAPNVEVNVIDSSKAYNDSAITNRLDKLNDTTGQGEAKSSLDALGDSTSSLRGLADSISAMFSNSTDIFNGCDTTGGKDCSSNIIGVNGVSSAVEKAKTGYGALKDTIGNSSVMDSIDTWRGLFQPNVFKGDGSSTCPAVLNKKTNLSLPVLGTIEFPAIGQWLCTEIGLGVTLWALARTIVRAMVAIGCMMFLYKMATGVSTSGDDDD